MNVLPAIEILGVGKEYAIGQEVGRQSFREMMMSSLKAPFARAKTVRAHVSPKERLWALKSVSFSVAPGEVLGIVGRNGAGKSTLLKILSRITEPTAGRVRVRGRVGSLLEVGTGFHPELTGRENVFLNGAILGMSQKEIAAKFDQIVEFADIRQFLDTPVKRYSSGMYVRLAFSVAAHLEPEILVVDEVLAVGDIEFQNKCIGKMGDVAGGGRTVIFVSHNMGAVSRLCSRVVWLEHGSVVGDGTPDTVIAKYWKSTLVGDVRNRATTRGAQSETVVTFGRVTFTQDGDEVQDGVLNGDMEFDIVLAVNIKEPIRDLAIVMRLESGLRGTVVHSGWFSKAIASSVSGEVELTCTVPANVLAGGEYQIMLTAEQPYKEVIVRDIAVGGFQVIANLREYGRYPSNAWKGVLPPTSVSWRGKVVAGGEPH